MFLVVEQFELMKRFMVWHGKWVVEVNRYVSSLSLKRVREHEAKITRIQSNVIRIMV